MSSKKSTSLSLIVHPGKQVSFPAKKVKQPKRKNKVKQSGQSVPRAELSAYVKTLNDPFTFPPIQLGFGTMVPTQTGTAYARGSLTTHADGSFAISMAPSCYTNGAAINTNVSGAAGTTWVGVAFTNASAMQAAFQSSRIVSGGIRVFCRQALTSAPGMLFAGSLPSCTVTQAVALSPTTISNNQMFELGSSISGATALIRPQSMVCYDFEQVNLLGGSTTFAWTNSYPFISGLGLPASTPIYWEAVINFEALCCNTGTGMLITSQVPAKALSDYFPSIDQLWSSTKNYLSRSGLGTMDLDLSRSNLLGQPGSIHYFNHGAGSRSIIKHQQEMIAQGYAL